MLLYGDKCKDCSNEERGNGDYKLDVDVDSEEAIYMWGAFGGKNWESECSCLEKIRREKISVVSPSVLSESTIGTAMDVTTEVMMYGINLVVWGVLYLYFQVIERNHSSDPPANLLTILLLSSCYFPLLLIRKSTRMEYTMLNIMMMIKPWWMMLMSPSQDHIQRRGMWVRDLVMRRQKRCRRRRRNIWT